LRKSVPVVGWILILAVPPVFLIGVEACSRLLGVPAAPGRSAEVPAWLDRNILVKDAEWMRLLSEAPGDLKNYYGTYAWDRRLFYKFRAGVKVTLTDAMAPPGVRERTRWTLRTNGKGFPGPEVPYGVHPGRFRIVCMGDSSTFGWGVESEEAYPHVLMQELRRRHPGRAVEVVNLGVCGYSSFQGRILMEIEAARYEPDVVTLSYGSNDWSRVPEPFDVAYERNAGWSGALREFLHRSRAYEAYAAGLSRWLQGSKEEVAGADEMPLNVGPEKSRDNLIAMVNRAEDLGAAPILVTNCVQGEMSGPVREAALRTGARLLDTETLLRAAIPPIARGELLPELRARTLGLYGAGLLGRFPDLEVYLADRCHPNVAGQRILGMALADLLDPLLDGAAAAPGKPGGDSR